MMIPLSRSQGTEGFIFLLRVTQLVMRERSMNPRSWAPDSTHLSIKACLRLSFFTCELHVTAPAS